MGFAAEAMLRDWLLDMFMNKLRGSLLQVVCLDLDSLARSPAPVFANRSPSIAESLENAWA